MHGLIVDKGHLKGGRQEGQHVAVSTYVEGVSRHNMLKEYFSTTPRKLKKIEG